jgi:CubicO group peptidase (beta-lactamase class C family)
MGAGHDAYVGLDPLGAPRSAGGLCVTLRDLARFGQLHLDGGRANGRQIVPERWIRDIRENGDAEAWRKGVETGWLPGGRYRSKWYDTRNPHGAFCGIGIHGQWIWVDPQARVVCAKLSSMPTALDADENAMRAFHAIGEALA